MSRAVVVLVSSLCLAAAAAAADVPKEVAAYLESVAGLPRERLAALERGEAIAKTVAAGDGEIAVVGAVRVRTTKAHVADYFETYLGFEDGSVVLRVGRFARPPALEDLARLEFEKADLEALRDCRPGSCDLQIGAKVGELQAQLDWRAPDAAARAQGLVKRRLLDYVRGYQEQGDKALVTYVDESRPVSLAAAWRGLLGKAAYLYDYAPRLQRYLEEYPRERLEGTRDFVQWSKVDQGLKPVVLVTHVVLYEDPATPDRLSFALKQIYASRYYDGAFSVATVVEAVRQGAPLSYVVFANRTRAGMLQGRLGAVKRKLTVGEVQKATELTLRQMQEGLERVAGTR